MADDAAPTESVAAPEPAPDGRTYKPPSWSTVPTRPWRLDVVKDGVIVESVDLGGRDHYVLGKRPDACDIVLAHESVSRQHAALQFGEQGELYVADLGSTHGTRLNKLRLPAHKYTLVPPGSVLQFGASTRLYVVEGPPELAEPEAPESAAHAKLREASEARQARKAQEKLLGGRGVTWGQADDAVDDGSALVPDDGGGAGEDDDEAAGTPRGVAARLAWLDRLELAGLGEKEHAACDRLHRDALKLRHLLAECDRIKAKRGQGASAQQRRRGGGGRGGGDDDDDDGGRAPPQAFDAGDGSLDGLSEGQVAQLARNEGAIEKLVDALCDEEEAFKERLAAKGVPLPRGVKPGPVARGGGGGFGGMAARRDEAASFLPDADDEVDDRSSATWAGAGSGARKPAGSGASFVLKRAGSAGKAAVAAVAPAPQRAPAAAARPAAPSGATASNSSSTSSTGSSSGVETYESLTAKLAAVDDELARLRQEGEEQQQLAGEGDGLAAGADGPASAAASLSSDGGSVDDGLEAYMRANAAALAATEAARRQVRMGHLTAERARLARLVDIVKPAVASDVFAVPAPVARPSHARAATTAAAGLPAPVATAVPTSSLIPAPSAPDTTRAGSSSGGGNNSAAPIVAAAPADPVTGGGDGFAAPLPRAPKRVLGPAGPALPPQAPSPPPSAGADAEASGGDAGGSAKRARVVQAAPPPPSRPGAAASAAAATSSLSAILAAGASKARPAIGPPPPAASAAAASGGGVGVGNEAGGGEDLTWRPPTGQTGDGRTALNDKLGY